MFVIHRVAGCFHGLRLQSYQAKMTHKKICQHSTHAVLWQRNQWPQTHRFCSKWQKESQRTRRQKQGWKVSSASRGQWKQGHMYIMWRCSKNFRRYVTKITTMMTMFCGFNMWFYVMLSNVFNMTYCGVFILKLAQSPELQHCCVLHFN